MGDFSDPKTAGAEHKAQRWKDYQQKPPPKTGKKLKYDKWSKQYDRNMDNWKRGLEDQNNALEKIGVANNDHKDYRFTFFEGKKATRPDGVTDKAIIDCKSLSVRGPPQERVLYFNDQLKLQRKAAKSKLACDPPINHPPQGRKFAVVMLSENKRMVRPSRNLANPAKGADYVFHRTTRRPYDWSVWDHKKNRWKKIKASRVSELVGGNIE
jgi:hypothetical protein